MGFSRKSTSQPLVPKVLQKKSGHPNGISVITDRQAIPGPGGECGTSVNQKTGLFKEKALPRKPVTVIATIENKTNLSLKNDFIFIKGGFSENSYTLSLYHKFYSCTSFHPIPKYPAVLKRRRKNSMVTGVGGGPERS